MILGIDPKVDYAFQYLLGRESTKSILIDVLNIVLNPPPGHEIVEIELLNPLNLQEALDDKLSILDIKARDRSGRLFNVEMQMLAQAYYAKRVVYYSARLHKDQLNEGQDYGLICQTISINFLNHVLYPKVADYHLRFHLLEDTHHFQMTDDLEFHILQLPKFNKELNELKTGLDIWLYFLRNAEKIDPDALPAVLEHPTIVRAIEELKMLTQSDIEREKYESRRKFQLDQDSAIIGAAREAKLEGQREGQREGKEIGERIGLIHAYEQVLQLPETPDEQLLALPPEELLRLSQDLKQQALAGR
jgi:predicted transposase/invertase (TIGR01784 family)